jgi:hypothetical protein
LCSAAGPVAVTEHGRTTPNETRNETKNRHWVDRRMRCSHVPLMAPLCVKSAAFPPVDGAPVLAPVKQTALDCGCGSALGQGVGNAVNKGLGRR